MIDPVIKCPFCPMCGAEPLFIAPGLFQTWCPNEDCQVFMWVPWHTAAENLSDITHLDLPVITEDEADGKI